MAKPKLSREDVAMIELGQTTISRSTAIALVATLLVTILIVPIVQHIHEIGEGKTPQVWSVFTNPPSEQSFQEFERELEDASIIGERVLPQMQRMLVGIGAGNEQAYLGPNGWLFYRPGFDFVTGRGFLEPEVLRARRLGGKSWDLPPEPDPTPAIVSFRDQLRARGIELIIMPTTVKPQLDPTGTVAASQLPLHNPSFQTWLEQMNDAGVRVFDPCELLAAQQQPFLKTDTHWTATAMRAVAKELAAIVKSDLPARAPLQLRSKPQAHQNLGDIAVMLRLPDNQKLFEPETVALERVEAADGSPWSVDESADVLLLGDSFSNIFSLASMGWGTHSGFAETLSLQLQRPLDRITINDSGALQTRRALRDELRRGRDRLAGKKLVIWQFASRELAVGDWQVLELPKVETAATVRTAVTIKARIAAQSTPPQPGSVPYKDCLIGVRLEAITVANGTWPDDEDKEAVLLYVMGMQDNAWTAATKWQVGSEIELRLVPWEGAPEAVRSLNRRELDDDDLMLANPWFTALR
ncbi:MAG: hypothetical protein ACI8UD_001785 [Planctomycetota bacterium]|jgi:hypothetical protein